MERVGFHENLAALAEAFGRERLIPLNRVAAYLGVDRRTLLRDASFPVKKVGNQYRVPIVNLARWLNV